MDITLQGMDVYLLQQSKYKLHPPLLYKDINPPFSPSVSHSQSLCPGRPPQSLLPSVCTSQCCSSSPGDWGWPQSRYELQMPPSAAFPTEVQEEEESE